MLLAMGSSDLSAEREETSRAIWTFEGFPSSYDMLGESQGPVGPELMLELAARSGLSEHSVVVDAACYDASTSFPLVERHGCRLVGVDLSTSGFEARRKAAGADARLSFVQGRLEAIPLATGSCDLVWCRDALSTADCAAALRALARIAKPAGTVLLHTTCATPLLEPAERAVLFADLALDPSSMDVAVVEAEAARAGLAVQESVVVGSEWLQHRLEKSPSATDLLNLARLTQWPERYAAWGETWYRRILRWSQWPIYQALGKLQGHVWLFERVA